MRQMPLRALRFVPDPLSRPPSSLSPSMPAASPLTPPSTVDRSFCSYADRAWKYQTALTRSCKRSPPAVHAFTNHDHHASRLSRALKHHTSPHIRACQASPWVEVMRVISARHCTRFLKSLRYASLLTMQSQRLVIQNGHLDLRQRISLARLKYCQL